MKSRILFLSLTIFAVACSSDSALPTEARPGVEHLEARPVPVITSAAPGRYTLSTAHAANCCVLQVPQTAGTAGKLPLLVMLHGAGFTEDVITMIFELGEQLDFAVLAPRSANPSWDVLYGGFGVDVARIDESLAQTFQMLDVDASRIALAGFSDGASYALTLGLANGDLFTHVIAFSPGFIVPVPRIGKPRFYITHGRMDGTLPFRTTEEAFVPFLKTLGYVVEFVPFEGGHSVPATQARDALTWLVDGN